jgi:hypothetical protein
VSFGLATAACGALGVEITAERLWSLVEAFVPVLGVSAALATNTQAAIVDAVAQRGYLAGYTGNQIIARQLVKELEELCEAFQSIRATDQILQGLVANAAIYGKSARAAFDIPSLFVGVEIDRASLRDELPDLVVPLAVLAAEMGVPDLLAAGFEKAQADAARGVR